MGQEEMKAMIADVTNNPDYNFDVFSITRRLQSGWVLAKNDKNMMQTKGYEKIKFDIVF